MEKYIINYQKKETKFIEKNSIEYFERINNVNNKNKDARLTFMNC